MFRHLTTDSLRVFAGAAATAGLAFAILATGCDKSDPAATTTTTSATAQAQASDPTVPMNVEPAASAQGTTAPVTPQTPPSNAGAATRALPNVPNGASVDAHGQPMNAQPSFTGNRGVGGHMYQPGAETPSPTGPTGGSFTTSPAPGSMNGTQPMNNLGSVQMPGSQSNGATGAPNRPSQNMNGVTSPTNP